MCAHGLESLANELFEMIVEHLSLADIGHLRLVSHTALLKATQDTFRQHFATRKVDLTRQSLRAFAEATSFSQLACSVQDLSLVGIVYNPMELSWNLESGERMVPEDLGDGLESNDLVPQQCTEAEMKRARADYEEMTRMQQDCRELHRQHLDVALLEKAFANLAAHRKGLKSLTLEIIVFREDTRTRLLPRDGHCWKWVFKAAARTFKVATICLHKSGLPIHRLNAFAHKPESLDCSLPCDALSATKWDTLGCQSPFKGLSALQVSLSDYVIEDSTYNGVEGQDDQVPFDPIGHDLDTRPLREKISDERNVTSLCEMLSLTRELVELDLQFHRLQAREASLRELQETMHRRYLCRLARLENPLESLRTLRLGGLNVISEHLCTFLWNHRLSLRDLELRNVHLDAEENFDALMSLLKDMDLELIHLEDLFEGGDLVLFDDTIRSTGTRVSGDYLGGNVIHATRPDTKRKIACSRYEGYDIGSGKGLRWRLRNYAEFGRVW